MPFSGLLTWGNPPFLANMNKYKLASSHAAQAVGYPAQGCGSDSSGGATVGGSLVGVGAAGAFSNQTCEIPHPGMSTQSALGPNCNLLILTPSHALCPGPCEGSGPPS
jgi:hypothetical protein